MEFEEAATAEMAPALAAELLGGVDSRLAHSLAVGRRVEQLTADFPAAGRDVIVASAYLHDIGYSPQCVDTTWHPLDGARWLARHGWAPAICRLVLWHTAAWHEGRLRGLYAAAADESIRSRHAAPSLQPGPPETIRGAEPSTPTTPVDPQPHRRAHADRELLLADLPIVIGDDVPQIDVDPDQPSICTCRLPTSTPNGGALWDSWVVTVKQVFMPGIGR